MKLKWDQGDAQTLSSLQDDQALVDADWAKSHAPRRRQHAASSRRRPASRSTYKIAGTFKNQAGLTATGDRHRRARWRATGTSKDIAVR